MSEMQQPDRTKAPAVTLTGKLSLPEPSVERLSNGILLYTLDGGVQPVTQFVMMWQGGTVEGATPSSPSPSVARIACNLMREGAGTLTGAEISELLDFHGAMLRISPDSHYTTMALMSLNSMILSVLPVVRDIICFPTLPEATFERLRENAAQECRLSMAKVMTRSNLALMKLMKGEHHPELGYETPEIIRSITIDDVRGYCSETFTADGCRAYLSGRITDEVYTAVKAMLESLPAAVPARPLIIEPYSAAPPQEVIVDMPDALQAAVSIGLPAPSRDDPDYVPLRFTVTGLGGFFGSRLMKNIREDKGYTYGISSYLLGSREGGMICVAAQADPAYVDALVRETGTELTRMATEPFTDTDMQRLRQYISLTLMAYLDSSMSIMDYYRTIHCVGLPEGYFNRQVECLHTLTADEICRISAKYLVPGRMRIAVAK